MAAAALVTAAKQGLRGALGYCMLILVSEFGVGGNELDGEWLDVELLGKHPFHQLVERVAALVERLDQATLSSAMLDRSHEEEGPHWHSQLCSS